MDLKGSNENGSTRCRTISMKCLFFIQGIVLAAIGAVCLLTNTGDDVEYVRLKNSSMLLLLFSCMHVFGAVLVCCIHDNNNVTNWRLFIGNVLWSCWISGFVTFQTLSLYEYEQTIKQRVLYEIVMTGILYLLTTYSELGNIAHCCIKKLEASYYYIITVWVLHMFELCKPKPEMEKSHKLLLDESWAKTSSRTKLCDTFE